MHVCRPSDDGDGAGGNALPERPAPDGARDVEGRRGDIDPDGAAGPASPFTFDNPDFNVRSLRGTGVLRWEYRPGSTLYFVWTQERDGFDQFGDFNFNRDRSALFWDRPTNVFQIKGTYWIGR